MRRPSEPFGRRFALCRVFGLVALCCCARTPEPERERRTEALAPASSALPAPQKNAVAASRATIPEGSFMAGTEPGTYDRQPELEPPSQRFSLGSFEIDVHLQPRANAAHLTASSRGDAQRHCAAAGGRLCTELEWERACKGPGNFDFPSGPEFDPACTTAPSGCASGFGVYGMGLIREWTASDVEVGGERVPALRGAIASEASGAHRCAKRTPFSESLGGGIGFRCCYGAPNAAQLSRPKLGSTFEKHELPVERLQHWLARDPRTRELATDLTYFPDPEAARTVLAKGDRNRRGFLLTTQPLRWNPVRGAEFLVVAGRSGAATSFVVVFHVLGADSYRLASSFIMRDEPGPIALAYNGYIRPRLHFSSCWGCAGETGKILYRDPDRVVILQP